MRRHTADQHPVAFYVAHARLHENGSHEIHSVEEHARDVAELGAGFADAFGNGERARLAGAETGARYRVCIAPRERRSRSGVDQRLNPLMFKTEKGKWVGSMPIYCTVTLESLSVADLMQLLD